MNTKIKYLKLWAFALGIAGLATIATFGQQPQPQPKNIQSLMADLSTNDVAAELTAVHQAVAGMHLPQDQDKASEDIATVLDDFGLPGQAMVGDIKSVLKFLAMLFVVARIIRKATPNSAQQGSKFFQVLAHIGLEVDPKIAPLLTPKTGASGGSGAAAAVMVLLASILMLGTASGAKAQLLSTNSVLGEFWSGAKGVVGSTNLAGYVAVGRSLKKNYNLVGIGVSYNITPIFAPIFGLDERWNKSTHVFSSIQGGLSLQFPVQPLATVGITNFTFTPFTGVMAANGNDGSVLGSVFIAGAYINLVDFGVWNIDIAGEYENCQGQGVYSAPYAVANLAATRNLPEGEPLVMRMQHDEFTFARRTNKAEDMLAKLASKARLVHYEE